MHAHAHMLALRHVHAMIHTAAVYSYNKVALKIMQTRLIVYPVPPMACSFTVTVVHFVQVKIDRHYARVENLSAAFAI